MTKFSSSSNKVSNSFKFDLFKQKRGSCCLDPRDVFFHFFHECFLASTVVAIQQQSFSLFSFLSGSVFLQMTYFTDEACCSSSDAASAKMLISLVCFSKSSVMSVTTNQSHTSSVSKYNNNTKDK